MTTDIYIKTYRKDFPFLKYCLKSIHKFCSGFNSINIVVDANDYEELLSWNLTSERVFAVVKQGDGYMWQQACKLKAYQQCFADQILFVDSDCVFFKPTIPESFMRDGKPLLMKTKYERLDDQAKHWQGVTAKAIGYKSEYEWMRRLPLLFKRETLERINVAFPHLETYIMGQPGREFSEFNFIGQWIERNEADQYYIIDTDDEIPAATCNQEWSWGGMTPEVENRIKQILGE